MYKIIVKTHGCTRLISLMTASFFFLNIFTSDILAVNPASEDIPVSTLAAPSLLPEDRIKEEFMLRSFLLAHPAPNNYIGEQIRKSPSSFRWVSDFEHGVMIERISVKDPRIKGYIGYDVEGLEYIMVVKINGLFAHTGQWSHEGLTGKHYNGVPVVYVDTKFFERARDVIQKHGLDEILQWENLRINLLDNKPKSEMRQWIREYADKPYKGFIQADRDGTDYNGWTARQIAMRFHEKSFPLESLYEMVNFDTDLNYSYIIKMLSRYGRDETSGDINTAAKLTDKSDDERRLMKDDLDSLAEFVRSMNEKSELSFIKLKTFGQLASVYRAEGLTYAVKEILKEAAEELSLTITRSIRYLEDPNYVSRTELSKIIVFLLQIGSPDDARRLIAAAENHEKCIKLEVALAMHKMGLVAEARKLIRAKLQLAVKMEILHRGEESWRDYEIYQHSRSREICEAFLEVARAYSEIGDAEKAVSVAVLGYRRYKVLSVDPLSVSYETERYFIKWLLYTLDGLKGSARADQLIRKIKQDQDKGIATTEQLIREAKKAKATAEEREPKDGEVPFRHVTRRIEMDSLLNEEMNLKKRADIARQNLPSALEEIKKAETALDEPLPKYDDGEDGLVVGWASSPHAQLIENTYEARKIARIACILLAEGVYEKGRELIRRSLVKVNEKSKFIPDARDARAEQAFSEVAHGLKYLTDNDRAIFMGEAIHAIKKYQCYHKSKKEIFISFIAALAERREKEDTAERGGKIKRLLNKMSGEPISKDAEDIVKAAGFMSDKTDLDGYLADSTIPSWMKADLLYGHYMISDQCDGVFESLKSLYEKEMRTPQASTPESLETQRIVLAVLAFLVREKGDFSASFNYLRGKVRNVIQQNMAGGDGGEVVFGKSETLLFDALIDTGQPYDLIGLIYNENVPISVRKKYLIILSEMGILDKDLATMVKTAEGSGPGRRLFELIALTGRELGIPPTGALIDMLLKGKVTVENLKAARPKVENKTLPELLDLFSNDKTNMYKLAYYVYNQPKLTYDWPLKFDLFKAVVDEAIACQRDKMNGPPEALWLLQMAITKSAGAARAGRIIKALQEGSLPFDKESGLVDEDGNFIPQEIRVDIAESRELRDAARSFIEEFNKRFVPAMTIDYLIASIRKLVSDNSSKSEAGGVGDELRSEEAKITGLGNINSETVARLKNLHCRALKLIKDENEQSLMDTTERDIAGFFGRVFNRPAIAGNPFFNTLFTTRDGDTARNGISLAEHDLDIAYSIYAKHKDRTKQEAFDDFMIRSLSILKEEGWDSLAGGRDGNPSPVVARIWEEMSGHFKVCAESYCEELGANLTQANVSAKTIFLSCVPHKDILSFMRFADGAQCCICSNKKGELEGGYNSFMANALVDEPTLAFVVHSNNAPMGFILGHLCLNNKGMLVFSSLKLYMKKGYRSETVVQNIWNRAEEVLAHLNISKIGQSTLTSGLSCMPPNGYKEDRLTLKRLQTATRNPTTVDLGDLTASTYREVDLYLKDIGTPAKEKPLASGYQKVSEGVIREALDSSDMLYLLRDEEVGAYLDRIERGITARAGLEDDSPFLSFLDNSSITVEVRRPKDPSAYKYGLNVRLGEDENPGRDVYATVQIDENGGKNGKGAGIKITISEYTSWSGKDVLFELIGHELYGAYRQLYRKSAQIFEVDIKLEQAIDKEITAAKNWERKLDAEEKDDLGLIDGRLVDHVRERAFARLIGVPSYQGQGTRLTDWLRMARRRAKNLKESSGKFKAPKSSGTRMDEALEYLLYLQENQKDVTGFIDEKLSTHKSVIWNYANFSGLIFNCILRTLGQLITKEPIGVIAIPIGTKNQGLIDEYMKSGDVSEELVRAINTGFFPEGLDDALKDTDLILAMFNMVYRHNRIWQDKKSKQISIKAIPAIGAIEAERTESIAGILKESRDDRKAIVLNYFSDSIGNAVKTRKDVYSIIHVDPDIGFIDGKDTKLSYCLWNVVRRGANDFALAIDDKTPFKDEEIQLISDDAWIEAAVSSLRENSKNWSAAYESEIRTGLGMWRETAHLFNYYKLYDGVVCSTYGSGGDQRKAMPEKIPDTGELVPVGVLAPIRANTRGSPAAFLQTIRNNMELLKKARGTSGFAIKEITSQRKTDDGAVESTVYKEVELLLSFGILVKVDNYDRMTNPNYRFSDAFIGPNETYTKFLIESVFKIGYTIGTKRMPLQMYDMPEDKYPGERAFVKELVNSDVDIENAAYLLNRLLPKRPSKPDSRRYIVRYNKVKLDEYCKTNGIRDWRYSPEALINMYVKILQEKGLNIEVKVSRSKKQDLISIECYADKSETNPIGTGNVNIKGGLREQPLRMISIFNMALAASNIRTGVSYRDMDNYERQLISFIKYQCRIIAGADVQEDRLLEFLRNLPLPKRIQIEKLEEYYRSTIYQLQQSA